MSEDELRVIAECLDAAVRGPFFSERDFHALMGSHRADVARIRADWPQAGNSEDQDVAVRNVLNNLLGYPHRQWDRFGEYSSATPRRIAEVLTRWRGEDSFDPSPKGFFDRLE